MAARLGREGGAKYLMGQKLNLFRRSFNVEQKLTSNKSNTLSDENRVFLNTKTGQGTTHIRMCK
jgi:hypothetical protein